jgi:hypothetical protein
MEEQAGVQGKYYTGKKRTVTSGVGWALSALIFLFNFLQYSVCSTLILHVE